MPAMHSPVESNSAHASPPVLLSSRPGATRLQRSRSTGAGGLFANTSGASVRAGASSSSTTDGRTRTSTVHAGRTGTALPEDAGAVIADLMRDYEVDIQGAAGKLGKLLRAVDDKKRELAKVSASLAVAQERGDADVPDVAHTAANASPHAEHTRGARMLQPFANLDG